MDLSYSSIVTSLLDKHSKSNVFTPLRLFLAPLSRLFILHYLLCSCTLLSSAANNTKVTKSSPLVLCLIMSRVLRRYLQSGDDDA